MLKISDNLSLPVDAVTQTLAILAKRRVGKSYTARRFAEQLLTAQQQVVILDPKGDWWGIRSSADGKSPGFPVIILGGEHGDLPLDPGAADTVSKLVVMERANLLLDLSDLRKKEIARFMGGEQRDGFLEAIYRLKAREEFRFPMMLVVDEADALAPQNPFAGEERMLGAMEDIVRRGGQRGMGCMLVTQRSAVLNKNVLTQSEILVAMRTIAPQDRKAMEAWIDVHGTVDERKTLMDSLASLPLGDAWFWAPGWPTQHGIFKRVHVSPIETFDSGATPKPGQKRKAPKTLADIDLQVLQRQMAETIEKAKAEDPKELRRQLAERDRRIRELEKKGPVVNSKPVVDLAAVESARAAGNVDGRKALARELLPKVQRIAKASVVEVAARIEELSSALNSAAAQTVPATTAVAVAAEVGAGPQVERESRPRQMPSGNVRPASPDGEKSLTASHRKVLTALAQYPEGLGVDRLAALSGYTVNGHFTNMLGWLRTSEYISPARVTPIQITRAGEEVLGSFEPLPVGEGLRAYWLSRVGKSKAKILVTLFDAYPEGLSLDEVASRSNYTVNGHFTNMIGSLRTMGLITPPRVPLKAMDYLFEE